MYLIKCLASNWKTLEKCGWREIEERKGGEDGKEVDCTPIHQNQSSSSFLQNIRPLKLSISESGVLRTNINQKPREPNVS